MTFAKRTGGATGMIKIASDFDDPLPDDILAGYENH